MQHDESPKQDYLPDPSISEEGPWHFYVEKGRVTGIGSHDFTHDAMFSLSGDFSNNEERLRYANEIVSRLNAYGKVIKPDNAVETHEALRSLVDHMDYLYDVEQLWLAMPHHVVVLIFQRWQKPLMQFPRSWVLRKSPMSNLHPWVLMTLGYSSSFSIFKKATSKSNGIHSIGRNSTTKSWKVGSIVLGKVLSSVQ
jgi:hypothetical protein